MHKLCIEIMAHESQTHQRLCITKHIITTRQHISLSINDVHSNGLILKVHSDTLIDAKIYESKIVWHILVTLHDEFYIILSRYYKHTNTNMICSVHVGGTHT